MGKIHRLSQEVIGKIAAGEVVERPQAVVKELVENSLDAGATGITVEITRGGLDKIKVVDNGAGIAEEDLVLAFEKNATSKLFKSDELFSVQTLGFRGEALHSIAAVSRVTLLTRQKNAASGIKLLNTGGEIQDIQPASCAEGTSITVSDLFFNAPVRRDFLKKPSQEAGLVSDLMRMLILSHPEVSFRFKSDNNTVYLSAGDGKLESAFLAVYGLQTLKATKKVNRTENGIIVEGLVGVGEASRGNRNHENFFINGRAFKSMLVSKALEEAVRQRVMIGRFPMAVLYITMPFNKVDVNVHPNKWEVRFSDEKKLHNAIFYAVEEALSEGIAKSTPAPFFIEKEKPVAPPSVVQQIQITEKINPTKEEITQKAHEPSPYLMVKDPAWQENAVLMPETPLKFPLEETKLKYAQIKEDQIKDTQTKD
ncbi:MAG: DNA mismatch repair endonuclease MutL, partial [Eubacteriales bacterium]|nr:DNA mismatch repair endonuclease MutL [Eubacteriales bacterium]